MNLKINKPSHKMKGEITHKEKKQARKKAIENLENAKKIEAGKKYYRKDKRTIALRKRTIKKLKS